MAQELSSLVSGAALKLLVTRSFCDLDEMRGHCIGSDWGMGFLGRVLGGAQAANEGPALPAGVSKVHSGCGFFPAVLSGGVEGFDQVIGHVWVT